METSKLILTNKEKEFFFEQLENNSEFFKETLEAMLSLVVSDPLLTYQVADLIKTDYRNLYNVILKNQEQQSKNDSAGCCHS